MRSKAVPPPQVRLLSEYFRSAGYHCTNNAFTDFQVPLPGTAFDECSTTAHWRDRPDPDQPFFALFHGMVTHESQIYLSDEDFARRTEGLPAEHRHDAAAVTVPPYHPDDDTFRTAWARYHDLVSVMDAWVGGILDQLDEDGLAENTIVVFWSDHGAGFPRAKRWATEAGLRVPLIVRWPERIAGGRSRDDVVHLADIGPTMLELAGLDVPVHMQFSPLFTRSGEDREQGAYAFGGRDRMDEQHDRSRTVRDARYRYVRHHHADRSPFQLQHFAEKFPTWQDLRRRVNDEARQKAAGDPQDRLTEVQRRLTGSDRPAEELYDLVVDPHETVDLARDPQHAAVLERLSAALDAWTARVGDLGAIPEDDLIRSWRPNGTIPRTSPVTVESTDDGFAATCPDEGAIVGWTFDPPKPDAPELTLQERILGSPDPDGRVWHICDGHLPRSDKRRWVRAWRLGHLGSEATEVPVRT